ncbi:hypothetical protein T484DRAFT_1760763, partial [Baffinella frigidus]
MSLRPFSASGHPGLAATGGQNSGAVRDQLRSNSRAGGGAMDGSRPRTSDAMHMDRPVTGARMLGTRKNRHDGWRRMWDPELKAYFWVDTRTHSAQWHEPGTAAPLSHKAWDGKAAAVTERVEKVGLHLGLSQASWFPGVHITDFTAEESKSKVKRSVAMMLQKWNEKWGQMTKAFRELDIDKDGRLSQNTFRELDIVKDGRLSQSELRSALIRFNIGYTDALLDE